MQNTIAFFGHNANHRVYYLKDISPSGHFDIRCMEGICGIKSLLSGHMLFDIFSGLCSKLFEYQKYHFTFFDESVGGKWGLLEYIDNDSVYLGFRTQDDTIRQIARVKYGKEEVLPSFELTPFNLDILKMKTDTLESNVSIFYESGSQCYLLELFLLSTLF